MALTLTNVADLAAVPTGFTAVVAGTGGAAVTIMAAPADRPFSGISFQPVGGRTGDGSVSLAVPAGFYFVIAKIPTDCTVAEAVRVTDGQDVVGVRCQDAVSARLRLLDLEEIGRNVYDQFLPDGSELRYPCAVVHWDESAEAEEVGLNGLDYLVYPIQVHLYDSNFKKTVHDRRKVYLRWRHHVGTAFRHQRLAGVPESAYCDVAFGRAMEPAAEQAAFYCGTLVVRATCRIPRGLGA